VIAYNATDRGKGSQIFMSTMLAINAEVGGHKVKVVTVATMWQNPHVLILDTPTNYLNRDGLGALTAAIEKYGGDYMPMA